MLGWLSAATALASRLNRSTALEPLDSSACISFTTTCRSMSSCSATNTAPMPPSPSFRWMRNWLASVVPMKFSVVGADIAFLRGGRLFRGGRFLVVAVFRVLRVLVERLGEAGHDHVGDRLGEERADGVGG